MNRSSKAVAVALLSAGALVSLETAASASVVCNREGQCWHVRRPYAYAPAYGVVVHPDNWRWGAGEHYVWREHPGRGYWRGGVWVHF